MGVLLLPAIITRRAAVHIQSLDAIFGDQFAEKKGIA
jgi:hypothetical protein